MPVYPDKTFSLPYLSVIIPVFNVEPYLRRAIDSILTQWSADYEMILVNDGSSDGSAEILNSYENESLNIRVFHRSHAGQSVARNFGYKQAKGKYIYFFDADDILTDGALMTILNHADRTSSDMVFFSASQINETDQLICQKSYYKKTDIEKPIKGEDLLEIMLTCDNYSASVPLILFRKSFLDRHNVQFSTGYIHEDEAYTAILIVLAEKATSLSKCFYLRRLREGSTTHAKVSAKNIEGWAKALNDILIFTNNNQTISEKARRLLLIRAERLTHHTLKVIRQLNRAENINISLTNYLDRDLLSALGYKVYLNNYSPLLYKGYKRISKIFKTG